MKNSRRIPGEVYERDLTPLKIAALARGLSQARADVAVSDIDLASVESTARNLDALGVRSIVISN